MESWFNSRYTISTLEVKIGENTMPQVSKFMYCGSIIQNDKEIEGDVNHGIEVGWMKWTIDLGVICNKKVSLEFKGKF